MRKKYNKVFGSCDYQIINPSEKIDITIVEDIGIDTHEIQLLLVADQFSGTSKVDKGTKTKICKFTLSKIMHSVNVN